jgi:hypothetical protein
MQTVGAFDMKTEDEMGIVGEVRLASLSCDGSRSWRSELF